MPGFSAKDLDAMLKTASGATAPNVGFGAASCYGLARRAETFDTADGVLRVADAEATVLIRDGALANLVEDAGVTVDGSAWLIRNVGPRLSDGTRRLTLVPYPTITGKASFALPPLQLAASGVIDVRYVPGNDLSNATFTRASTAQYLASV